MDYAIELLEESKKHIEKHIRSHNLMQTDMKLATEKLGQVNQLRRAIKILKLKNDKR